MIQLYLKVWRCNGYHQRVVFWQIPNTDEHEGGTAIRLTDLCVCVCVKKTQDSKGEGQVDLWRGEQIGRRVQYPESLTYWSCEAKNNKQGYTSILPLFYFCLCSIAQELRPLTIDLPQTNRGLGSIATVPLLRVLQIGPVHCQHTHIDATLLSPISETRYWPLYINAPLSNLLKLHAALKTFTMYWWTAVMFWGESLIAILNHLLHPLHFNLWRVIDR